jgi:hypothetical protein
MVLDDSPFKNLKQGIVLTDKKIYWNVSRAYSEPGDGESAVTAKGPGSVRTEDLKTVSVFVQNTSSGMVIHMIEPGKWIRLTLKWFENDEALKILFYYYLSKFAGNYNPNHGANEERYTGYLKEHKGKSVSVIPLVYDVFNHALIGALLLNLIVPRFTGGRGFAENGRIIFFSVTVKLLGILFHYRKSALMNSLLIVIGSAFFILPGVFPRVNAVFLALGYAAASTLFSIFDFDRIFKYLIFALAIASAAALFLQFFWLGPLV